MIKFCAEPYRANSDEKYTDVKSYDIYKSPETNHYVSLWGVGRCSRGSTFDCRTRSPWLHSYTGLTCISQGTRNKSPRLHSTKV